MHCFREANKCADALARRGALLPQDLMIFMNLPPNVVMLLSLDAIGTMYDRFVPSSLEAFYFNEIPYLPKIKKKEKRKSYYSLVKNNYSLKVKHS